MAPLLSILPLIGPHSASLQPGIFIAEVTKATETFSFFHSPHVSEENNQDMACHISSS